MAEGPKANGSPLDYPPKPGADQPEDPGYAVIADAGGRNERVLPTPSTPLAQKDMSPAQWRAHMNRDVSTDASKMLLNKPAGDNGRVPEAMSLEEAQNIAREDARMAEATKGRVEKTAKRLQQESAEKELDAKIERRKARKETAAKVAAGAKELPGVLEESGRVAVDIVSGTARKVGTAARETVKKTKEAIKRRGQKDEEKKNEEVLEEPLLLDQEVPAVDTFDATVEHEKLKKQIDEYMEIQAEEGHTPDDGVAAATLSRSRVIGRTESASLHKEESLPAPERAARGARKAVERAEEEAAAAKIKKEQEDWQKAPATEKARISKEKAAAAAKREQGEKSAGAAIAEADKGLGEKMVAEKTAEENKAFLKSRETDLDRKLKSLGGNVGKWLDRYNSLNWKWKLGIAASLVGGAALTSVVAPWASTAFAMGMFLNRAVASAGFGKRQFSKIEAGLGRKGEKSWYQGARKEERVIHAGLRGLTYFGATMALGVTAVTLLEEWGVGEWVASMLGHKNVHIGGAAPAAPNAAPTPYHSTLDQVSLGDENSIGGDNIEVHLERPDAGLATIVEGGHSTILGHALSTGPVPHEAAPPSAGVVGASGHEAHHTLQQLHRLRVKLGIARPHPHELTAEQLNNSEVARLNAGVTKDWDYSAHVNDATPATLAPAASPGPEVAPPAPEAIAHTALPHEAPAPVHTAPATVTPETPVQPFVAPEANLHPVTPHVETPTIQPHTPTVHTSSEDTFAPTTEGSPMPPSGAHPTGVEQAPQNLNFNINAHGLAIDPDHAHAYTTEHGINIVYGGDEAERTQKAIELVTKDHNAKIYFEVKRPNRLGFMGRHLAQASWLDAKGGTINPTGPSAPVEVSGVRVVDDTADKALGALKLKLPKADDFYKQLD